MQPEVTGEGDRHALDCFSSPADEEEPFYPEAECPCRQSCRVEEGVDYRREEKEGPPPSSSHPNQHPGVDCLNSAVVCVDEGRAAAVTRHVDSQATDGLTQTGGSPDECRVEHPPQGKHHRGHRHRGQNGGATKGTDDEDSDIAEMCKGPNLFPEEDNGHRYPDGEEDAQDTDKVFPSPQYLYQFAPPGAGTQNVSCLNVTYVMLKSDFGARI